MKKDSDPIEPGMVLAGKYLVERVLGSGGMGMVVAAQHLQLDEKVAIKLQLPSLVQSAEARARFAREARAAVKIKSEYVARVSDVGLLDSGAPYMVMEYLEGEDLADMLARGPLPVEQAVEFMLQACEALAEAHALGIIHRDIKPANLFCVRRTDGLLATKLLDFGVSRASSVTDIGLTNSGVTMGSPHYMAPEQMLAAKNADERSDIWSLGAVLFELLTAEPPFDGETFAALVLEVTTADATKLAQRLKGFPPGLVQVVVRCLNIDAASRYSSVSELALALVPFGPAVRGQVHADRITRIARTSQNPPSAPPPEGARAERREKADGKGKTLMPFGRTSSEGRVQGSRTVRLVMGAFGVLGLGAGGWWAAVQGPTEAMEPSPNAIVSASSPQLYQEAEPGHGVEQGMIAPSSSAAVSSSPAVISSAAVSSSVAASASQPPPQLDRHGTSTPSARTARAQKSERSLTPAPAALAAYGAAPAPESAKTTDPNKPNLGGRL